VWNVLLVCLMYFCGQSKHFIWYMPLLLYLSAHGCCFIMFCTAFCILNATFVWVSLNSFFIFLVSFPLYEKAAHFVFRCCGAMYSAFVRLDVFFLFSLHYNFCYVMRFYNV
jgi:hypothetical protein